MNVRRLVLALAVCGFSSLVAHAQLLILNGHVTSTTGIYDGVFAAGDSVEFTLNFSDSGIWGDIWAGHGPGEARYIVTSTLTIAGTSLPFVSTANNLGVRLLDSPSAQEGLQIGNDWGPMNDAKSFRQNLLGVTDIMPSIYEFPAGVPFGEFTETNGWYKNYYTTPGPSELIYTGSVEWDITSYSGSARVEPRINAVPESSTIGLFAAGSLGLAIFIRRGATRRRMR